MKNLKKFLSLILIAFCLMPSLTAVQANASTSSNYYIVNKKTGKYHLPSCSYLPESDNRTIVPKSRVESDSKLSPCKHCDPDSSTEYIPITDSSKPNNSTNSSQKENDNSATNKDTPFVTFLKNSAEFLLTSLICIVAIVMTGISVILGFQILESDDDEYKIPQAGVAGCTFMLLTSGLIFLGMRYKSIFEMTPTFWITVGIGYAVSVILILIWHLKNRVR